MDPTVKRDSALEYASRNGKDEIVKLLLDWVGTGDLEGMRVDPTADGNQAIKYASKKGHAEIVKLLL